MPSPLVRLVLQVAFCACSSMAVGQRAIIRELKSELVNGDLNVQERARKLERLSWYQRGADPVSAMVAAQKAIAIAERINDHRLLGSAIVVKIAEFVVPLVKAVQEQQLVIEEQRTLMLGLTKRLDTLEKRPWR